MSDPSVRFADEVVRRPERAAPVELVDTIESPVGPDFTKDEAQRITAKIGGFAAATWRLLGIARKRQAHKALGYRTFADYMSAEFDLSKSPYSAMVLISATASDPGERAQACAVAARALADGAPVGAVQKSGHDSTLFVEREWAPGVGVQLQARRSDVCEWVVTGTTTEEVPDPEVVAAAPLVTVEREVGEWRCSPLLGAVS